MSTVTDIVNRLLAEDAIKIIDSPDKAYRALQEDTMFEAPSLRLKRTLCRLLGEKEENLKELLAESYCSFKKSRGEAYTLSRAKTNAGKWLEKNTVPERETVYEILLDLQSRLKTVDAVKDLITSGFGEYGFNVRSPRECVYFYCFSAGKNYADAQRLLEQCAGAEAKEGPYHIESTGSGDTTMLLWHRLNDEWDTEEKFMEFLLENKALFSGRSASFAREYEKLYLELSSKIRLNKARKRHMKASDTAKLLKLFKALDPDFFSSSRLLTEDWEKYEALKKAAEESGAGAHELQVFLEDPAEIASLQSLWNCEILPRLKDSREPASADEIERCISRGIPRRLKCGRSGGYNGGAPRKAPGRDALSKGRFRIKETRLGNKESELYIGNNYGTMAKFPQGGNILLPEKMRSAAQNAPENKPFDSSGYRKLMVLMFYFSYFFPVLFPLDRQPVPDSELSFRAFVRELSEILYRSHLAPLYNGDHFDWLILSSAAAIENGCLPSAAPESEGSEIMDAIMGCMEDCDYFDSLGRIIRNAEDDEILFLSRRLLEADPSDLPDTVDTLEAGSSQLHNTGDLREELLAAIEGDDEVYERFEDMICEYSPDMELSYGDLEKSIGDNPLDFFSQVIRLSYGGQIFKGAQYNE